MAKKTKTIRVKPHPDPFYGHPGHPGGPKTGCCSMGAALRSVKRGQFRLAARYARVTVRVLGQRATGRPVGVWS